MITRTRSGIGPLPPVSNQPYLQAGGSHSNHSTVAHPFCTSGMNNNKENTQPQGMIPTPSLRDQEACATLCVARTPSLTTLTQRVAEWTLQDSSPLKLNVPASAGVLSQSLIPSTGRIPSNKPVNVKSLSLSSFTDSQISTPATTPLPSPDVASLDPSFATSVLPLELPAPGSLTPSTPSYNQTSWFNSATIPSGGSSLPTTPSSSFSSSFFPAQTPTASSPSNSAAAVQSKSTSSSVEFAASFHPKDVLSDPNRCNCLVMAACHQPTGKLYVLKYLTEAPSGRIELTLHRPLRHNYITKMCGFYRGADLSSTAKKELENVFACAHAKRGYTNNVLPGSGGGSAAEASWGVAGVPAADHSMHIGNTNIAYVMVLEHVRGGCLASHIAEMHGGRLPEEKAQRYALQICSALRYLHVQQRILHADLKLDNILYDPDTDSIKLCDFGLSVTLPAATAKLKRGSLCYLAPEVVRGGSTDVSELATRVDIWSLGICVFVMLLGQVPFHGSSTTSTLHLITQSDINWCEVRKTFLCVSDAALEFLKQCLQKNPFERPDILTLMRHEWLQVISE